MIRFLTLFTVSIMLIASVSAAKATVVDRPVDYILKEYEIPGRYAYGIMYEAEEMPTDAEAGELVLQAAKEWNVSSCHIAWYGPNKRPGQGVMLIAETSNGETASLIKPRNPAEAIWLEKVIGYSTSPLELTRQFIDNEVVADETFTGKKVVFESVVGDIGKGAFNKPYVFFPTTEDEYTGITCYFDEHANDIRKIRKGSFIIAKGTIKSFLMQDVILHQCEIVAIRTK